MLADIQRRETTSFNNTIYIQANNVEAQVKSNGHTLRKTKYEQVMAELYSYRFTGKG